MNDRPTPPSSQKNGTLTQPDASEQREAMRHWQQAASGMDGARGGLPASPDDPVAYKLLDAAGNALERGQRQKCVNILRLVVKDYHQSAEAACARTVIDRLAKETAGHGR